jgi:hypothetical protein
MPDRNERPIFGSLNGGLKGPVNWEGAPEPVQRFLQGYTPESIDIINVRPDWDGAKLQLGVRFPSHSLNLGVKTDFHRSFRPYASWSEQRGPEGGNVAVSGEGVSPTYEYAMPGMPSPYLGLTPDGKVWSGVKVDIGEPRGSARLRLGAAANVRGDAPSGNSVAGERAWANLNPVTGAPETAGNAIYDRSRQSVRGTYSSRDGIHPYDVQVDPVQWGMGNAIPAWRGDAPDETTFYARGRSRPDPNEPGIFEQIVDYLFERIHHRLLGWPKDWAKNPDLIRSPAPGPGLSDHPPRTGHRQR